MKKNNNKGFTLAELLIVVAIIGVLIAIAMPTFGSQLEKARIAADQANLRAAYGEAVASYLVGTAEGNVTEVDKEAKTATVSNVELTHKATASATALTGTWLDTAKYTFPFKPSVDAAKLGSGKHSFTFTFGDNGTVEITSCT